MTKTVQSFSVIGTDSLQKITNFDKFDVKTRGLKSVLAWEIAITSVKSSDTVREL